MIGKVLEWNNKISIFLVVNDNDVKEDGVDLEKNDLENQNIPDEVQYSVGDFLCQNTHTQKNNVAITRRLGKFMKRPS